MLTQTEEQQRMMGKGGKCKEEEGTDSSMENTRSLTVMLGD